MTHRNKMTPEVLVVGAGPTGLVLALCLARQGIAFRIIDKASGPGQASRALVVHARTLEFYRQLGLADDVIKRGIVIEHFQLRNKGTRFVSLALKDLGHGLSPYPFLLGFPQDDHERFLGERLAAAGVRIEWGVELVAMSQDATTVRAVLQSASGQEPCEAAYVCGCDGARSAVRAALGVDFSGGTYSHLFYVADVKTTAAMTTDLVVNLGTHDFALVLPVRSSGMSRIVGIVPDALANRSELRFDDFRTHVEDLLGLTVSEVNWFSTYHVHHRVAARFHVGRCFLAGDAGHIHSPAGGQGMNTGIGDAINLSWKLADVIAGRSKPDLLETYDTERSGFARTLVATTDTAFQGIVGQGMTSRLLRTWIVPTLAPLLMRFSAVRRQMFKAISQIRISYRNSALSSGRAGQLCGGDRLPWVQGLDNFAPLTSFAWQLHVYGAPQPELTHAAQALGLPCHTFAWTLAGKAAGLSENAAYLIRPDGHLALALSRQSTSQLKDYVVSRGLLFRAMTSLDEPNLAVPTPQQPP